MIDVVNRLLEVNADLVVTITTPLERHKPGNDGDRIRLRNLLAEARRQVLDTWDAGRARPLLERLDAAAHGVELAGGANGLVVVATTEMAEAHLLPFPVRQAVALGTTPATRFLVQGLRRTPRFRVLVLSERATRLFVAARDELTEVLDHGFPMSTDIVPIDRRAVAGRFAREGGHDDDEAWRNFYRDVDQALIEATGDDPLPLVLAGVHNATVLFQEVARHPDQVVGRLDGAHDEMNARDLGRQAWPILRDHLREQRKASIARLADALHTGRAVTGIDEVWQLGREGRGWRVVVEEDYRSQPAREVDGRLVPVDDASGAEVMDDPVDEIIEHVIRAGGTAEFVEPDTMAHLGRIGLFLR